MRSRRKAEKKMTGTGQGLFIATLLGALVAATATVSAQTVPLPPPAPLPKSGTVPPPPSSAPATRPAAPIQGSSPAWLPPFFGGQQATPGAQFEPAQRAL